MFSSSGDPNFDLFKAAYPYSLTRAVQLFGYGGVASIAKEVAGKIKELGGDEIDVGQAIGL